MNALRIALGVAVLLTPVGSAAARGRGDAILEAYWSDPEIGEQVRRFQKAGYEEVELSSTPLGDVCGYAGCARSTLIVHSFRRYGPNAQTRSILAVVHSGPRGRVRSVDLVELRSTSPRRVR